MFFVDAKKVGNLFLTIIGTLSAQASTAALESMVYDKSLLSYDPECLILSS